MRLHLQIRRRRFGNRCLSVCAVVNHVDAERAIEAAFVAPPRPHAFNVFHSSYPTT